MTPERRTHPRTNMAAFSHPMMNGSSNIKSNYRVCVVCTRLRKVCCRDMQRLRRCCVPELDPARSSANRSRTVLRWVYAIHQLCMSLVYSFQYMYIDRILNILASLIEHQKDQIHCEIHTFWQFEPHWIRMKQSRVRMITIQVSISPLF